MYFTIAIQSDLVAYHPVLPPPTSPGILITRYNRVIIIGWLPTQGHIGLADDVNIACPPEVLGEIATKLRALAMSECGLKTQATKNRVYVQPSARAGWLAYLEENPRPEDPALFSIHDFPDGRIKPTDDMDTQDPF